MKENRPILLLWDIDGTLIRTNGAGKKAITRILMDASGGPVSLEGIPFAGYTDREIVKNICKRYDRIEPRAFLDAYLEALPDYMRRYRGEVCPGVVDLLEWADGRQNTFNALLTGNVFRGAKIKLSYYRLDHFFVAGAYGDDHMDRNSLGPIAIDRMAELTGHQFDRNAIWVIGDTPRDIDCARAAGVRVLAVATGFYGREELEKCSPDAIFDDLSDFQEVIESLLLGN